MLVQHARAWLKSNRKPSLNQNCWRCKRFAVSKAAAAAPCCTVRCWLCSNFKNTAAFRRDRMSLCITCLPGHHLLHPPWHMITWRTVSFLERLWWSTEEDIILMSCLSVHVTLSLLTCIINSVCVCVDHQTRREVGGRKSALSHCTRCQCRVFWHCTVGLQCFFPSPSRVA